MKKSELESDFYLYGNKGAFWSGNTHIARSGIYTTLCGVPMLARNWSRFEKVEEAGCPKCIERYKEINDVI